MPEKHTAFFYGTLMHPKILQGVIQRQGKDLQICPALLLNEECPAMLPYKKSRMLFSKELKARQRTVRGTLVKGLTDSDMVLLDRFEGKAYTREKALAHPLGPFEPLSSSSSNDVPLDPPPLPPLGELPSPIEAQTYIWAGKMRDIRPDLWEYSDFVRNNAAKWIRDATR
ncbi:hypothetical protein CERSUDRAFT_76586 [Gelatoporia subvermispora B]|uniref:Putative gamma-glutamylcyclotransferase n=1 Tax=Ceriporiopsis subvermispora (strain B) TaxID=914234 RepID=M2Q8Z7_CERS8|nr:hypothetical protein CERSUDRAFT_76586 [Gelatoporia subvermispora B]